MWNMLSWEIRWELRCWVVDDERMIWAIEIVDLKFIELDWIDELCELFVFDGNGWLICGKPREKMRLKAYAILWDKNWAMWNCTKWLNWKKCPEREKI